MTQKTATQYHADDPKMQNTMGKWDKLLTKILKKDHKNTNKCIKMRIPSWDYTGVLDHHSGVILPRRRPKHANHDGEMGQITNTNIEKKTKNTKTYIKMRIPSWD